MPIPDDIRDNLASVIERLQRSACPECGQPPAECACTDWGRNDMLDSAQAFVLI